MFEAECPKANKKYMQHPKYTALEGDVPKYDSGMIKMIVSMLLSNDPHKTMLSVHFMKYTVYTNIHFSQMRKCQNI